MNALAPAASAPERLHGIPAAAGHADAIRRTQAAPTYFAVLFTDSWDGDPPTKWADALRLLATLAEENSGYLGYDVEVMDGGREYAVTHWASPGHIRQWKKASEIVIGDNGLLSRIYGQEGCLWPWLEGVKPS